MNDSDLNSILRRAASVDLTQSPTLPRRIMDRIRVDEGRQRRWRAFVIWLLALGIFSGVLTAFSVGWLRASQDQTHLRPPRLDLSPGGLRP
jgi:hypothetical protein